MKTVFFFMISACLVGLTPVLAQQYQQKRLATFATDSLMEEIFKELEINHEKVDKNIFSVTLKDQNVLVNVDNDKLYLYAPFKDKPTLNRINDFNMQYRWVRVYLDQEGELMMADELDFGKGISLQRIVVFFNTFEQLLAELITHMK